MRVSAKAIVIAAAVAMVAIVMGPRQMTEAATGPVSALVLSDFGDVSATVARMQALGWTVTAKPTLETMQGWRQSASPFASDQVVWVPARTDFRKLHLLMGAGGQLESFVRGGGVLVVADLSPVGMWLDIAPGGVDASSNLASGAGAVAIQVPEHVLITGAGVGGVVLTAADLDPEGVGGRGRLINLPADRNPSIVAGNAAGPVLVEYAFGAGRVVVSTLQNPSANFEDNLLRYVQLLVP